MIDTNGDCRHYRLNEELRVFILGERITWAGCLLLLLQTSHPALSPRRLVVWTSTGSSPLSCAFGWAQLSDSCQDFD